MAALSGHPTTRQCVCEFSEARTLGSANEVPEYHRRPYILNYYRLQRPKIRDFFTWHNETLNIWTHLIGMVLFVVRAIHWYNGHIAMRRVAPFSFYSALVMLLLLAAITCLLASSLYHWRICTTLREHSCYLRLDHTGIMGMCLLQFVTGVSLGYSCEHPLQLAYLRLTGVIGVAMLAVVILPPLHNFQILTFSLCGVSGLLPCGHWFFIARTAQLQACAPFILATIIGYSACLTVFTKRWPECLSPGRFDLVGHSHQIFHVLVFLATAAYLEAIIVAHDLLQSDPASCVV